MATKTAGHFKQLADWPYSSLHRYVKLVSLAVD